MYFCVFFVFKECLTYITLESFATVKLPVLVIFTSLLKYSYRNQNAKRHSKY